MRASDVIPSLIRTYVPLGVGVVASWLATRGFGLDAQTQAGLVALLTGVLTALYYTGVKLLEQRYPVIGTIFLGLGLKAKPVYHKPGELPPPVPPQRL